MPVQAWIHHWEEGAGARIIKVVAALLAFLAVAAIYDRYTVYDLLSYENYSSEEAMESAQLARNIAQGRGYTTDSIRPVALYFLEASAEPGQSTKVLGERIPDLSTAPVYPYVLAGLMKAIPFQFTAGKLGSYQPDRWICLFNQLILFAAVLALFFLARQLFDAKVAWLSAILFAGTGLFWKFSISGLSTLWLILVFLIMVGCMAALERRDRLATEGTGVRSIPLALLVGALVGLGGLSRYAFAWMIVPVLLFIIPSVKRGRVKLSLTVALAFLAVMTPWLWRNVELSGHWFGTAQYAAVQDTSQFPDNTFERSSNPRFGMKRLVPSDIVNKFVGNTEQICREELPKLGGNWVSAFFLVGLLIPFRNPGLMRLRWFLLGSILLFIAVQAMGRTHVSAEAPEINSENLLVVLAPLIFMYGAALFHTLIAQLNLPRPEEQATATGTFAVMMCAPFALGVLAGRPLQENSPYWPLHLQQTAHLMRPNEFLTTDIPSGMAWYGERSCVWLPLNSDAEFFKVNGLKPLQGLFLTQVTTDKRFLSQMKMDTNSWGYFALECAEHGEVPSGFPLRKAPAGLLPEQVFLSDKARW